MDMTSLIEILLVFSGCFIKNGILGMSISRSCKMSCKPSGERYACTCTVFTVQMGNDILKMYTSVTKDDNVLDVECEATLTPKGGLLKQVETLLFVNGTLECGTEKKCNLTVQVLTPSIFLPINCKAEPVTPSTQTSISEHTNKGTLSIDSSSNPTKENTSNGDVPMDTVALAGAVIMGVIGGVVITVVAVVVWWKCAGGRTDEQVYPKPTRGLSVTEANHGLNFDQHERSRPSPQSLPEYTYIAIDDTHLREDDALSVRANTGRVDSQNVEDLQITNHHVGDHSEATTTHVINNHTETAQLTSDYLVLMDDHESQNTYNKLGASSLSVHEEQDTYNRIGETALDQTELDLPNHGDIDTSHSKSPTFYDRNNDTEPTPLTPDYFVLEDNYESQNTNSKLRFPSEPSLHEQDAYSKTGETALDQTELDLTNHGDGDTSHTRDIHNILGAPSELTNQERDIYNRIEQTTRRGQPKPDVPEDIASQVLDTFSLPRMDCRVDEEVTTEL